MSHTVHTEMNYTAAFLMSGSFNNVSCCQFKLLLGLVGSFESAQREHYEEIFLLIWFLLFSVSFWYCFWYGFWYGCVSLLLDTHVTVWQEGTKDSTHLCQIKAKENRYHHGYLYK